MNVQFRFTEFGWKRLHKFEGEFPLVVVGKTVFINVRVVPPAGFCLAPHHYI